MLNSVPDLLATSWSLSVSATSSTSLELDLRGTFAGIFVLTYFSQAHLSTESLINVLMAYVINTGAFLRCTSAAVSH